MNGTRAVGTVEPVVIDMHLPAGTTGPNALSFDVRFLGVRRRSAPH